ncbi:MAG: hypothetical protein GC184_06035 [Rhizobiales bacterium]|nr:hypothetical protein [Hyphomicrobiales bacterium]
MNRVVLGQRDGDYGLWVSPPGVDVLTASLDNLLIHPFLSATKLVAQGSIYVSANTSQTIYFATQPVVPIVLFAEQRAGSTWSYTKHWSQVQMFIDHMIITNTMPMVSHVTSPSVQSLTYKYLVLN